MDDGDHSAIRRLFERLASVEDQSPPRDPKQGYSFIEQWVNCPDRPIT
jgi:hypothetical protein